MREMSPIIAAVREAGAAIVNLQKKGFSIQRKSPHELVTEADMLANQILKKALCVAIPEAGWLSEECVDDHARLKNKLVWIIDPIDGTKEFIKGIPEFAISVALVDGGTPVLAVVYNPLTDELFIAQQGMGATLNGEAIHCATAPAAKLELLASRSEVARGEWSAFTDATEIQSLGSIAYKLALVAAGRAHATFSLGPKNEWDIAAGVLLVTEAGGLATNKLGQAFHFNREKTLVDGVVAASRATYEQVMGLIQAAEMPATKYR